MALEKIHQNVGWILAVSRIYETPAWGFEGNSFLNACISVSTRLEAQQILTELLNIETELGRERSDSKNYGKSLPERKAQGSANLYDP